MKKKLNWNLLLYVFVFFLSLASLCTIGNFFGDNYYNYGFAYNVVQGMIPYRDFNALQFPFSFLVNALIMKIFGKKIIVFYIVTSLVITLIFYLSQKINKGLATIVLYLVVFECIGGYNILSLLLFLLIIYLEKNKKNDYLIGFLIGLIIMTNQKMILLAIPSFLLGDIDRTIKRFKGAVVPVQIILFYLFASGAFRYFIDYTILGMFDFGEKNTEIGLIFILEIIMSVYMVYKYVLTKKNEYLYCLLFQIIVVPIFDFNHFKYAFSAFLLISFHFNKYVNRVLYISFLILTILILPRKYDYLSKNYYFDLDYESNCYLTIRSKNNFYDLIYNYYNDNSDNDIYIILNSAYYFKMLYDIPVNKFDMSLNGNYGYNGNEKMIDNIEEMEYALFIIYDITDTHSKFDQTNYDIINFIKSNYQQIDDLGSNLHVYEVVN